MSTSDQRPVSGGLFLNQILIGTGGKYKTLQSAELFEIKRIHAVLAFILTANLPSLAID
ncbi:MAG: hypothetical protein KGJ05_07725 [Alphaproteobacteria bacterium]|nr:hypothetical protein [Alphaproteobacteria bacterium]